MKTKHFTHPAMLLFALAIGLASVPAAFAQGTTAFTYQGQLRDGSTNANGTYSLTFKLYDAASNGSQVGPTLTAASQFITNGLFSAPLDFGAVFTGPARWLEITVQTNVLSPRELITPAPYALYSSTAGTAAMLDSANWNVSVGNYQTLTNVLRFYVNNALVLGMSSNGVYVNGNLEAPSFKLGTGGGSISSDGQGGVQVPGSLTVSNLYFTGNSIQFPSRSGALIVADTNGDFIFNNNLRITALGGISLPAPGGSRSISANNQGVNVDGISLSAANGVIFPTGGGGAISITANSANGIYIPLGKLTVNGPITCTALSQTSDRNMKEQFTSVNSREILERVAGLPISSWNFKQDANTRHIGPMAQDFYAAFNVGADDKHIATVDADGVALAAIQGLDQVVKEKDVEIATLKKRLDDLEKAVSALVQNQNGGRR